MNIFTRVKLALPDGEANGTIINIDDLKPPDCDLSILWDSPVRGRYMFDVHPHEVKLLEQATGDELKRAEDAQKILEKCKKKYEKSFDMKTEDSAAEKERVKQEFNKEINELMGDKKEVKEAATYDQWEQDEIADKYWAERGLNPSVFPHRDWIEDTRMFPKVPRKPTNQPELWWMRDREEDEGGGIGDNPGETPGFWEGSATTFMAMPAGNTISLTFEFMKDGLKVIATWDEADMPRGLSEEDTIAYLYKFLETNIPRALSMFKDVKAENVDLLNRTIVLKVTNENA